jgi:hypothetical protein
MRNLLVICICLIAAYCVDRAYYGGAYSRPVVQMLREIAVSYK